MRWSRAAVTRLRPILMTSLCTAFGAMPFLFAIGAGCRAAQAYRRAWCFMAPSCSVLLDAVRGARRYSLVARKTKSPHYMSDLVDKLMSSGEQEGATPECRHAAPAQRKPQPTPAVK